MFASKNLFLSGLDLFYSNPEATLGTPDLTVSSVGDFTAPSATVRAQDLYCAVDVGSFDASDYGVIWETGGSVSGVAASLEAGGQLYVAAYVGSSWQVSGQAYLKVDVSSYYNTAGTFYTTINNTAKQFNLYFQPGGPNSGNQAVFLGTSTVGTGSDWAGGGNGGLGKPNLTMVNFGFSNYNIPFTGNAQQLRFYYNTAEPSPFQTSVSITGTANVPVTGQSITSTLGTAVLDANTFATVSGEAMTAEEGIVDPSPDASVTGIGISASLSIGTVVIGTGNVELTGEELTISNTISVQDTLKAFSELPFASQNSRFIQTGNITISADANTSVTGEILSIAEGSVTTTANANVIPTGIELTMQENSVGVSANANVFPNGIGFTANLGTAVLDANTIASPNGQEMTMQEGTATATDSVARPTGIEMSVAQGNARTLIWIPVDPGVGTTWNNVGTGASSTYTNVDTGTKPVWTEVDTAA